MSDTDTYIVTAEGLAILERARECWRRGAEFRSRRERCKRFTYGEQWSDRLQDAFGNSVKEEEMMLSQGNMPLTNNLIRRLVRNVLGVFRNRWKAPAPVARDPSEAAEAATIAKLLQ